MKRYEHFCSYDGGGPAEPVEAPDGEWVRLEDAAGSLRALADEVERLRSQRLADAGFTRRPSLRAMEMRAALELIAAPMRADGTWNRDREACRELAAEALGRYEDAATEGLQ